MVYYLYRLKPSLQPNYSVESMYTKYLSQSHIPIMQHRKTFLHIEFYYNKII